MKKTFLAHHLDVVYSDRAGIVMRSDMHKIIVERPRYGSAMPNKKTGSRFSSSKIAGAVDAGDSYDSGPRRASSAMYDKGLSDNLAPLRRYLMSQVGRPWRKIYSEIHQAIDTRSTIGLHVLQHLKMFVAVHTFIESGVVYQSDRRWRSMQPVTGFYVHPTTGLLCYPKRGAKMKT
jgi:hypothetical protein